MKKGLIFLIVGLIIGSAIGYFYHGYKYQTQLEAGRNWEASQALDAIVYTDVTDKVQIICNFGNKKTIAAKDTDIKFTEKDFDSENKFIGYDKNFLIQKVCGISKDESSKLIEGISEGKETTSLFDVKLTK
jgi:predicted negative regulator of RcsB-dependent stress response